MKFWVRLVLAVILGLGASTPMPAFSGDRLLVAQGDLDDGTAWLLVRDTADPQVLERFIAQFPNSPYVAEAQAKIDALNAEGGNIDVPVISVEPPTPPPVSSSSSSSSSVEPVIDPVELTFLVQGQLIRVGCYAGSADGKWGQQSERAAQKFYDNAHLNGSTEPTAELLSLLKNYPGRVCPPSCKAGQVLKGGKCVGGGGNPPPPPPPTKCFVFNSQNFCE
jgi:hypothetical protein